MAQEDKWVKDLVVELAKKDKKDLEPTKPADPSGSNFIDPTPAEALAIVNQLRAGLEYLAVIRAIKRGELTFSIEQIKDAEIAWQKVFAEKSKDAAPAEGEGK